MIVRRKEAITDEKAERGNQSVSVPQQPPSLSPVLSWASLTWHTTIQVCQHTILSMTTYYFIRWGVKSQRRDSTQLDNHCLGTMDSAQIKTFGSSRRQGSINIIPILKGWLDSQLVIFTPKWIPQICTGLYVIKREGRVHLWLEETEKTPHWRGQRVGFLFCMR